MGVLTLFGKSEKTAQNSARRAFVEHLDDVCGSLNAIRMSFNSVTDSAAIDALIYRENAVMCELRQIIREAKSKKISLEIYERQNNFHKF